jgi:hypothetical protein
MHGTELPAILGEHARMAIPVLFYGFEKYYKSLILI